MISEPPCCSSGRSTIGLVSLMSCSPCLWAERVIVEGFEHLDTATLDERTALRYNTCRGQERHPARLLSKMAFGRSTI